MNLARSAPSPLLGWYGDDFTGATDTLATVAQAGLRSLLFLGVPGERQLQRAGPLDALGIAGAARAMAPAAMQAELEPVGRFFARQQVPVLHYKVCSTFDSAPHVGSIGTAVATLLPHVGNRFVPIVGGQPSLGRHCVFGNLFARAGSDGTVHRIDRHPTMRQHPVTPMLEADLRRHLALQVLEPVASIDFPVYEQPEAVQDALLEAILAKDPAAVLLDVARAADLRAVGRLMWQRAQHSPLLAVGPSSVAQALVAHWQEAGQRGSKDDLAAQAGTAAPLAAADGPVFVLAGSLSPVTARQVAAAHSFEQIRIDAASLTAGGEMAWAERIVRSLCAGRSVLAVTAPHPTDTVVGIQEGEGGGVPGPQAVARACGRLLARVLEEAAPKRVGIAGGDTSSLGVQALPAWGLSYLEALAPGVALCRLHSDRPALDGLQLMLKGGQMGPEDLFERLLHGSR